jgi:phosphoglycolate phosphatase
MSTPGFADKRLLKQMQAVLFDLDGTLIETSPEIADAVNDTLA